MSMKRNREIAVSNQKKIGNKNVDDDDAAGKRDLSRVNARETNRESMHGDKVPLANDYLPAHPPLPTGCPST